MENSAKHSNPEKVYQAHLDPCDKVKSAKNLKQAQNLKYKVKLEERNFQPKGNIASHTVEMWNLMQDKSSSVQFVYGSQELGKANVVMYNKDVINDIRAHCGTESSRKAVLGIDKTYNLGPCYLTFFTFRNRNLINTGMIEYF